MFAYTSTIGAAMSNFDSNNTSSIIKVNSININDYNVFR